MIVLTRWTMHAGPMPVSLSDDPGPELERGTGETVAPQTITLGFVRFFDGAGKAQIQGGFCDARAGQRIAFDFGPLDIFEICAIDRLAYPRPMTVDGLKIGTESPTTMAVGYWRNAQTLTVASFGMPPPEQRDE